MYRIKATLLQRQRLKNWVKAALEQYSLQDARFVLLKQGTNQRKLVFRVDSPAHGRFVLRVYKLSRRSENLLPELLWLQALQSEMPFSVPAPVPTADGSLINPVSFKGASKPRRCTLLRWLPGEKKTDPSVTELSLAGSRVARLHRYCEQNGAPEGLVFPYVWDWDWVFGEAAPIWNKGGSVYSLSDLEVFRSVSERVQQDLHELGKGSNVFGIIHRDLHIKNFLFHEGEAYAIDFETCGWGYYLFDLAVTISSLAGCVGDPALMRDALLEGYQREHALPGGYQRHLETFTAMRMVQRVNQALAWKDPKRQDWGPEFFLHSVTGLKKFGSKNL